jgi:hypothetical protein
VLGRIVIAAVDGIRIGGFRFANWSSALLAALWGLNGGTGTWKGYFNYCGGPSTTTTYRKHLKELWYQIAWGERDRWLAFPLSFRRKDV